MTDLEIDKALALAIGWKRILPNPEADGLKQCWVWTGSVWRLFSHRDWNVIGPIAEKYDCFPLRLRGGIWEAISRGKYKLGFFGFFNADTPQKAIALAVIGAKK
jgi:hypothetical protein